MIFREYRPFEALKPYINCYWLIEDDYANGITDISFPDGCIELLFGIGLEVHKSYDGRAYEKEPGFRILGQLTKPYHLKVRGKGMLFGIRFFPHTFHLFSHLPVAELNDQVLDAEFILDGGFRSFAEDCLVENTVARLISELDKLLMTKIKHSENHLRHRVADHAVRYILREKERADLTRLARECNVSGRYLQKLFLEKVGYSPKFFVRVIRFQRSFAYLNALTGEKLTALAYELGYFDQAHFIRDFRCFTGLTPSQYQIAKHPVNQHFLQEAAASFLYA